MGATPEQVRSDIEQTRTQLSGDVDRLVERTSPRRIAERRTARVRSAMRNTKERVMGVPSEGGQKVHEAADTARQGVQQAAGTVKEGAHQTAEAVRSAPQAAARQAQGNPVAAGLIAFGGGLLLASLLPTTPAERQAGRQIREQAGELAEPVKDVAQNLAEDGKTTLRHSAEQVREAAVQGAQATGEEARNQTGQVTGR